jgi:hypothetical protein
MNNSSQYTLNMLPGSMIADLNNEKDSLGSQEKIQKQKEEESFNRQKSHMYSV